MTPNTLPPDSKIGTVYLRVSRLENALSFYTQLLGFKLLSQEGLTALLSASGSPPAQIVLVSNPLAAPKEPHKTGLYHLAIRLPDRQALGQLLQRLIEQRWAIFGGSDHLVSEALYLADQDRNGIELYVDKPRETWPYINDSLVMSSEPLNYRALIEAAGDAAWRGIHPTTDNGHIHLQVSDLAQSERFYHELVGLDVTLRNYPGALFLSAGGYHHHLGMNIWNSRGGRPSSPDRAGLIAFELHIPDREARQQLLNRLERAGLSLEQPSPAMLGVEISDRMVLSDPDTIRVLI